MKNDKSWWVWLNSVLTLKAIVVFNVILFSLMIVILSISAVFQPTSISPKAFVNDTPEMVLNKNITRKAIDSENSKTTFVSVNLVEKFYGESGDALLIHGTGFGHNSSESKLYLGSAYAKDDDILAWSDSLITALIPETASSGPVWIEINNSRYAWDGLLNVYSDNASSAELGIFKQATDSAVVTIVPNKKIASGKLVFKIAGLGESLSLKMNPGVALTSKEIDDEFLTIAFSVSEMVPDKNNVLFTISDANLIGLALVGADLRDSKDTIVPAFANPQFEKITF